MQHISWIIRIIFCGGRLKKKLLRAVKYFTDTDSIEQQELSEILEYAQQKRAMDIIALLLDYRNKHKEIDHFSKYDF